MVDKDYPKVNFSELPVSIRISLFFHAIRLKFTSTKAKDAEIQMLKTRLAEFEQQKEKESPESPNV